MSKSRAALTHLWPTLLLLATLATATLFFWYPYPFRQFGDSGKFALLLILTAAFIGPALTFLVYKKGKRGLLLDLVCHQPCTDCSPRLGCIFSLPEQTLFYGFHRGPL